MMTDLQIFETEQKNVGTSPTNNEEFEKNGYLLVKDLLDPNDLRCEPPIKKGSYSYKGDINNFTYEPVESQVVGTTSRYNWPYYKKIHSQIREKIEKIIDKKLYETYYYDRFYNPGHELKKHTDRDACEISVTFHISSNVSNPWPIWIKSSDKYEDLKTKKNIIERGKNVSLILNPGDGMIYKGCERPHWRDPLPYEYELTSRGSKIVVEDLYYHQIFFHYVLADGMRSYCKNDLNRSK